MKILLACVAINDQFANRLNWSQRQFTSSGDCSNGEVKPPVQKANPLVVPETVTTTATATTTMTATTTTTQCSSSLWITSDTVIDTMPVSGYYEMSSTMHNGHSTWESMLNDLVLFKAASGAWQLDRTVESESENADDGDCPSSAQLASRICTFPVKIASQDGCLVQVDICGNVC